MSIDSGQTICYSGTGLPKIADRLCPLYPQKFLHRVPPKRFFWIRAWLAGSADCRSNTLRLNDRNRFKNEKAECILCGAENENLEHFLLWCPAYSEERRKIVKLKQPYRGLPWSRGTGTCAPAARCCSERMSLRPIRCHGGGKVGSFRHPQPRCWASSLKELGVSTSRLGG